MFSLRYPKRNGLVFGVIPLYTATTDLKKHSLGRKQVSSNTGPRSAE